MPFKSVTAVSSYLLCLFILISKNTTLVTSPFFILSALKTLNEKLISFIWILLSLTSYSLISVCVHPELTNALILRFFLFFIFTFACTFNSFSELLYQLEIIYLLWDFTKISCTMPTQDLLQNSSACLLSCLIPPGYFFFIDCFPLQSFAMCPSLLYLKHFLVSFCFFFQHSLAICPYLL